LLLLLLFYAHYYITLIALGSKGFRELKTKLKLLLFLVL